MSPEIATLIDRYRHLEDYRLVALHQAGGLTPEAESALAHVLEERGIDPEHPDEADAGVEGGDEEEAATGDAGAKSTGGYVPAPEESLDGLKGWLMLVGVQLVGTLLFALVALFKDIVPLFTDGAYRQLSDPDSPTYYPWAGPLIIGEGLFQVLFIVFLVYLLVLFSGKSRRFPLLFISMFVVVIGATILDTSLMAAIVGEPMRMDMFEETGLSRTIFGAMIWTPYMLVSRRVKATFVR